MGYATKNSKSTDFEFFWGREGGPWSGATEEGVGGGVVRSFWGRERGFFGGGDRGQGWTGLRAWEE